MRPRPHALGPHVPHGRAHYISHGHYIGHTHIHVRSVFTLLSPFPMPQVVVGDGGGFAREGQAVGGCAGAALCLRGQISASGTTDALKTVVLIGAMRAYLGPGPPRGGAGASDPLAFLFRAHPIAPPLPCLAASLPPEAPTHGAVVAF